MKQVALILLPVVLLGSTYLAFQGLVAALDVKLGYLGGFLFYWIVWCFLVSWWVLGTDQMLRLFRDAPNRLGEPAWLGALFLILPLALGYGYAFPQAMGQADARIIALSLIIAIVNGTLEELLWRGAHVSIFPSSRFLATVYPAIGFAVWHSAPQTVVPSTASGGALPLVPVAALVGLLRAQVAHRSGSILRVTMSHMLFDFSGLGARIYVC